MKRFRLSTLMLLIVITTLCVALVVQQRRTTRPKPSNATGRIVVWRNSITGS